MNIKILNSCVFKALTNSFLEVQYEHVSVIYYSFSTVRTDSEFPSVSLTVLLDRISYCI